MRQGKLTVDAEQEFAGFEQMLAERLVELQQENPRFDLEHIVRRLTTRDFENLSDAALIFALERFRQMNRQPWTDGRSKIMAEQSRRQAKQNRFTNAMLTATLIITALGTVAALVALFV